jgi:predicted deacylase
VKETILSIASPFGDTVTLHKNSWVGGKSPDSILSIVCGMHGDQVNGLYINSLLTRFLDAVVAGQEPDFKLTGNVQIFPVVNIHAVQSGDRLWSFDDLDLDLAFPGNDKGEPGEQFARALYTHTADSTHAILLKTAHHHYEDAPHVQLLSPDRPTKKMAQSLGLDMVQELSQTPTFKLSLFSHWLESSISSLILSAGKPRSLDKPLGDSLLEGLVDLMVHTGVLSTVREKKEATQLQIYPPAGQHQIISSHAGLFIPEVSVGSFLKQGQKLGELRDIYSGETLEEYSAPKDGYLVTLRHYPVIFEKESVATLLTDKKQGFWPF